MLPLGLVYGAVAFRTRSAKWSVVGHCISGILAFGGSTSVSAPVPGGQNDRSPATG